MGPVGFDYRLSDYVCFLEETFVFFCFVTSCARCCVLLRAVRLVIPFYKPIDCVRAGSGRGHRHGIGDG